MLGLGFASVRFRVRVGTRTTFYDRIEAASVKLHGWVSFDGARVARVYGIPGSRVRLGFSSRVWDLGHRVEEFAPGLGWG